MLKIQISPIVLLMLIKLFLKCVEYAKQINK